MNTSLGAIPNLLYYYIGRPGRSPLTPAKAHADMKWFRSNIRGGSRLALCAFAIQFLLSFGHFHAGSAQAAPVDSKQSQRHDAMGVAAKHASNGASRVDAWRTVPAKTSSDDAPDGRLSHDCAICAVLALSDAVMIVTPPDLLGPQAAAFSALIADATPIAPNSAGIAFQPRAPPVS